MKNKIKVLIVDDSMVQREVLARGLSSAPEIDVVGTASNAFEARDKIIELRPDVMTCDIQMPRMDGIEFISRLISQYPMPVVVISAISEAIFEALNAGAVDFIVKPQIQSPDDMKRFIGEVRSKIKIAYIAKVPVGQAKKQGQKIDSKLFKASRKLIAIGASTGGTEAIYSVLKELPPSVPGIVIVQHIPPVFSRMFAERLCNQTKLEVKEAETGDEVKTGQVLVAPGDKHMVVCKTGHGYRVNCFEGEKVNGQCPAVDVLFKSVAEEVGRDAIGVLLTGMGRDGASGLLKMRNAGARTIGQTKQSCVVYGMPRVAYEIGAVEQQADLSAIPGLICKLANNEL